MATMFQGNVTQNIEPVVADYSPQIRAMKAGAEAANAAADAKIKMAELASGTITSLYDMYKTKQMQDVRNEAAGVTQEYRSSNAQAQQTENDALRQMREIDSYNTATGGGLSTDQRDEEVQAIASQVNRLKEAKAGGMSTTQYLSRLHALTKKSIASLPFKADQIRGIIASETGLGKDMIDEGLYFVKEQFSPTKPVNDPLAKAKMVKETITAMSAAGYGTPLDLQELYESDETAFRAQVKLFSDAQSLKAQNDTLEESLQNSEIADSQYAKVATPRVKALMLGRIGLGLNKQLRDKENALWKIAELQSTGQLDVDATAYKGYVGAFSTQLLSIIEENRLAARANINKLLEDRQNIPLEQQKAMFQAVEDEAASLSRKYTDKSGVGLRAMAAVFSNYQDETLSQQMTRVDLAMKAMGVMPASFVEAVLAGGTAEESIKKDFPDAWALIKQNQDIASQGTSAITSSFNNATSFSDLNRTVQAATSNGAAISRPPAVASASNGAPTVSPEEAAKVTAVTKAAVDVAVSKAMEIINNKAEFDAIDTNVLSTAFSTMVATGGHKNQLMKNYARFGDTLRGKLTVEDLAVLKKNVGNSTMRSIADIQMYKNMVNKEYGTNLLISVTGDGLMTLTIDPTLNAGSRGPEEPTPEASSFDSNQRNAIEKFRNMAGPQTATVVFGRAMLTEEDPAAIAQEYALAINNDQPIKPFYDTKGVVPTAPSSSGVIVAAAGNSQGNLTAEDMAIDTSASPVQGTVEPRTTSTAFTGSYDRAVWDAKYGKTHNPDGTIKQQPPPSRGRVAGSLDREDVLKFGIPEDLAQVFVEKSREEDLDPVSLADVYSRLSKKEKDAFIKKLRK